MKKNNSAKNVSNNDSSGNKLIVDANNELPKSPGTDNQNTGETVSDDVTAPPGQSNNTTDDIKDDFEDNIEDNSDSDDFDTNVSRHRTYRL